MFSTDQLRENERRRMAHAWVSLSALDTGGRNDYSVAQQFSIGALLTRTSEAFGIQTNALIWNNDVGPLLNCAPHCRYTKN
jgi:hypothetical protein